VLDPVDEMLFGTLELHPQVRDIYAIGSKQLEEMDKACFTLFFLNGMFL